MSAGTGEREGLERLGDDEARLEAGLAAARAEAGALVAAARVEADRLAAVSGQEAEREADRLRAVAAEEVDRLTSSAEAELQGLAEELRRRAERNLARAVGRVLAAITDVGGARGGEAAAGSTEPAGRARVDGGVPRRATVPCQP